MTVTLTGAHPVARVSPEAAAPLVGCSGDTLRRTYARDRSSVPYVYKAGVRIFVSTPLLHEHLHGLAIAWTDCPVCWQLGADPFAPAAPDRQPAVPPAGPTASPAPVASPAATGTHGMAPDGGGEPLPKARTA